MYLVKYSYIKMAGGTKTGCENRDVPFFKGGHMVP